jgi:glycosyltransferase involved in cell wall biosynthesis
VPALFGDDGVYGGAERYAYELARHMAKQTPTTLVTFGALESRKEIDGLEIHVIGQPYQVRGQRHNPIALGILAELRQADIVHCHQQHVLASSIAALFCRLTRRPVFVTDHGGGGWDLSSYVSTDRLYNAHLHVSNYSRRIFGHADKYSGHIIFGGTDTERFSPDECSDRRREVLFVGRLLPHKGIDDLVKAVPNAVPLRLIGREANPRYLADLRLIAESKLVTFVDNCNDADLALAYRQAACAVLPSVYRTMYGEETAIPELLGQTLLEAMSCGTPVICTAVSSMPELVEDGVTGFIVPPNDPQTLRKRIEWILKHPLECGEIGQAGRRRVLAKFTWPLVVDRCLKIYSDCASRLGMRLCLV